MRTGERAPLAPVDRMSNADRRHHDIPGANAHDAGRPEERRHTFESNTGPVATEYDATFDAEEDITGKGRCMAASTYRRACGRAMGGRRPRPAAARMPIGI